MDVDEQYVFIYEFSKHSSSSKAPVSAYGYFTDGTEAEMTISKIDGTKVYANNVTTNANPRLTDVSGETTGWFEYTLKDDGKYELTSISNKTFNVTASTPAYDIVDYSTYHTQIRDGSTTKYGNKATMFVVLKANGDVVTYTGITKVADIESTLGDTVVDMVYSNNYAKCVFIDLNNGTLTGGSNSSDTIFFYKNSNYANDTDDDNYYIYKAIVNGELTKVKIDQTPANSNLHGLYTDIEYSSKNFVAGKTLVNLAYTLINRDKFSYQTCSGSAVEVKKNTLTIDGVDYYMAEDGCQIFVIDGSDVDTYTAKQLAKDDLDNIDYTVAGVLNSDAEYSALYIYR